MKITQEATRIVDQFEKGEVNIREGLKHNAQKVLTMCDFYSNSKYLDGNLDGLGREKPFMNVVNYRVTVAKVATDMDIKDIQIASDNPQHWVKSMLLQKEAYEWMKKTKFGTKLNEQGFTRPKYGMVVVKKREEDGELYVDTVKFKNFIFDQKNFKRAKMEKHFLSPEELLEKEGVWDNVREIIRDARDKQEKDGSSDSDIQINELHGKFPLSYLKEYKGEAVAEEDEWIIRNQVYYLYEGNPELYVFADEEKEDPYKHLVWEEMAGRTLGRGVIEESEEAQVWTNDLVINEKNAMDLASRVVIKTNASGIANNILEVDNGKVFELDDNEDMNAVNLTPGSLGQIQNIIQRWENNNDLNTSTFNATTGEQTPGNTTYSETALLNQVASRPFDYRREEHGFLIQEIFYDWVIPHLIKKLKREHVLVTDFSRKELEMIDKDFAIISGKKYAKEQLLKGKLPTQEGVDNAKEEAYAHLGQTGGTRFLRIPNNYFDDIEAKVSVITTGEQRNKAAVLGSLSTILQTVQNSYNPQTGTFAILENETTADIFGTLVEVAGAGISPVSLMGGKGGGAPAQPKMNMEALAGGEQIA